MFLVKQRRSVRGFTLIEIGIVLFILVILAGIAIPVTTGLIAEQRVREHSHALQMDALTARTLAISENRPYEIAFTEGGFSLEPFTTGTNGEPDIVDSHPLPKDVRCTIQRWGADEFGKPDEQVWIFQPSGLCEPIRVHFQNAQGWLEFSFNPLTARPRDEDSHFQ